MGGTMYGPTGRAHMDREASTVPMVGGKYGYLTADQYEQLSRSQQRKYWAKLKRMRDYADKRRKAAPKGVPVRQGTGGTGSPAFTDGASRETERLMRQPRS
jgi:hypothetical protein